MPLPRRVVEKWNYDCLGYETNSAGEVALIYCKICREYSQLKDVQIRRKGFAKVAAETYVRGTTVVKKNNFNDHIHKSQIHRSAVSRVSGDEYKGEKIFVDIPTPKTAKVPVKVHKETTLMDSVKRLHNQQRHHLIKKMQIAHFTVSNAKSFNFYEKLANFSTDSLKVDLGNGYMNPSSGRELIDCLIKSSRQQSITEPLNTGKIRYYSIMNGGSNTAETANGDKELFLMKTAQSGVPTYSVISLEETEGMDADGLKEALETSLDKMELTINRKNHEIGLCSERTSLNLLMFYKVKADIGDHYVQAMCSSYSLESAIQHAFRQSKLNNICEKDILDVYNLFKDETLRWRLFKRQAAFMGVQNLKYKHPTPTGSRWVENQATSINSFNHNLQILFGFINSQTSNPYDASMIKLQETLANLKSEISHTDRVIFSGAKQDLLTLIQRLTEVFKESSLLLPPLLSCSTKTLESLEKLDQELTNEGPDALTRSDLFPNATRIINEMSNGAASEMKKEQDEHSENKSSPFYRSTPLTGSLQHSIKLVYEEVHTIVKNVHDALQIRLNPMIEDPLFQAVATFLDTASYGSIKYGDLVDIVDIIVQRFDQLLKANECNTVMIPYEIDALWEYTKRYLLGMSPAEAWQQLFARQYQLSITNAIHVAEIAISMPASNSEAANLFTFFQRNSNVRKQIKTQEFENVLRLRCDQDFSTSRYENAVDLFLTEHSNDETEEEEQPAIKRKKVLEPPNSTTFENSIPPNEEGFEGKRNIDDIDIDLLSSDEWTDTDSDSEL